MTGWCLREVLLSALVATVLLLGGARAVGAHEAPGAAPMLASEAPQPILRGIALIEGGSARVYLEDPRTGMVTTYGLWDTVGDHRIERIQENGVVLRRGDELVHLLFGVQSTAVSSDGPDLSPHRLAAPDASPASGRSAPIQSERLDAPIIASGQPWLDRLGIPRGALSQAIESAVSAQESDGRDN